MTPVTASFAVLILLLLTLLAMNTSRQRFRAGRSTDPKMKEQIRRASRAHGNLFEHGTTVLLLMFFYEANGGAVRVLCIIGTVFLLARLSYSWGMLRKPASPPMMAGAAITYLAELALIGLLASRLFWA
jgi:uncharacterized membrane protein YecN with MAPEG domain